MNQSLQPPDGLRPQLNHQERTLHDVLLSKDLKLAQMYFGSLMVFNDERNPDRLSLSAHGLRELMEKITEYVDVKIIKPDLKGKIRVLAEDWKKLQRCSGPKKNQEQLQLRFSKRLEKFFVWFEVAHPKRKEQIAQVLKSFEPLERYLPAPLEKLRVNEWDMIWSYFKAVAHHGQLTKVEEFQSWKMAMERFLLDRLCPRTFADQRELLDIIKMGETNA